MTEHNPHPGIHFLRPFAFGPTAAPGQAVWAGDLWLGGWSFTEASGAATAQLVIVDGNDANGVPGPTINLTAGQTFHGFLGGHLWGIRTGLFVKVNSGSILGCLFVADR